MAGIDTLPYLNLWRPQDRYKDAHFLLGRFELKVGGFLGITRAASDTNRSCRAACLDGGLYLQHYSLPFRTCLIQLLPGLLLFLKREGCLALFTKEAGTLGLVYETLGGGRN